MPIFTLLIHVSLNNSKLGGLLKLYMGFPGGSVVKNPLAKQETLVLSLGGKIPWRREWQPTPVFSLGKSHGQRNLEGYSPWGNKELDTTEHTHKHTH